MKIFRLALPLPMDYIPIEEGGSAVDNQMAYEDIDDFESRYDFKGALGEGSYGIAYSVGDDKVLKFTTDVYEYEAAKQLENAAWVANSPFATVYDAGEYGTYYYIVKEKVVPLTETQQNLFVTFTFEYNSDIEDLEETNKKFFEENSDLLTKFDEYITDVQNYTGFTDVFNTGNIGFNKDGDLVCFDTRLKNW
jgi:hypothetical protein